MHYTGDISVADVWKALTMDKTAVLVDVRTSAEWAFVGTCDLSELGTSPLLISWQEYPHMGINPAFTQMIEEKYIQKDQPLYFLCRSGVRSKAAAAAMVRAGYEKCYNILDGFEGGPDAAGHRGAISGWKVAGLPWTQG